MKFKSILLVLITLVSFDVSFVDASTIAPFFLKKSVKDCPSSQCRINFCPPSITCNAVGQVCSPQYGYNWTPIVGAQNNMGLNTFESAQGSSTLQTINCFYINQNTHSFSMSVNYPYVAPMQPHTNGLDNLWVLYPGDSNSAFCPNQETQQPDSSQCPIDAVLEK